MIVKFLGEAVSWIAGIPPVKQAQRFGNTAFRTWLQKLAGEAESFHKTLLPSALVTAGAPTELITYLMESFGNSQRIDYGSGHELYFVAWLCCLTLLGVFTQEDYHALVLRIFAK